MALEDRLGSLSFFALCASPLHTVKARGGICVQKIVLHSPDCPQLAESSGELHFAVENVDVMIPKIYKLMQKLEIPFYQVVPHNETCPGRHFPWEDLEFQLFTLEH